MKRSGMMRCRPGTVTNSESVAVPGLQRTTSCFVAPGTHGAKCDAVSDLGLRLEHLAAAVHAGLEIDVMRPAQLARILVLDIGRPRQGVGRAAHAAARRRCFSFRDGHGASSS